MIKMLNKIYNFRLWLYFTACIFLKLKKVTVTSPANSNFGSVNLSGRILSGDYDKVVPFLNIFKKNNQGNIKSEITMMKAVHRFSWLYHLAAQDDKMAKFSCQTLFEDWVENNSRFSLLVWDLETVGLRLIALSMNSNFILRSIRDENKFLILLMKQIMFLKLSYKLSKRGMPRLRVLLGIFFSTMILDGNKDSLGRIIIDMINQFVKIHPLNTTAITSMGQTNYLSTLNYINAVIGNSSSGIIEAPSFKIPTINIGDRQRGRIMAKSVINCSIDKNEITYAINKANSKEFKNKIRKMQNPYGTANVSAKVVKILKKVDTKKLLKKSFYNL